MPLPSDEKTVPWPLIGAIVLMAVLSGLSIWLYLGNGEAGVAMPAHSAGPAPTDNHAQQIADMVDRLAKRLENEPDNAHGWAMLARSYATLGRFEEAVKAFDRASRLDTSNDALFADYADAQAMVEGKRLQGKPEKLALRALTLNPDNVKALYLAGTAAFDRGEYQKARKYWRHALEKSAADSEWQASLQASIADVEQRLKTGNP